MKLQEMMRALEQDEEEEDIDEVVEREFVQQ
jgi:hypothetical protein